MLLRKAPQREFFIVCSILRKFYNRRLVDRARGLLDEGKLSIGLNLPAAVS